VRTNGNGWCAVHAPFGNKVDEERYELFLAGAADFLVGSLSVPYKDLWERLRGNDLQLLRNVISKFWADFVVPFWQASELEAPPEEDLFLQALRSQFDDEELMQERDVISTILQQQNAHTDDLKTLQKRTSQASADIFIPSLEQEYWRPRAFLNKFIPCVAKDFLHMSRGELDVFMTGLPAESMQQIDWLQPCTYMLQENVRVYGSELCFDGDMATLPACKYGALFDPRACFDGLRLSFLSRICGPDWQRIDVCLPEDLSDAQTEQLVLFYTQFLVPLKKNGIGVEAPTDFPAMAWQAFVDALATRKSFYLSYDELLLLCALRKQNIIVFGKQDDGHLVSVGEVLFDSSDPVVAVSSGLGWLAVYSWIHM